MNKEKQIQAIEKLPWTICDSSMDKMVSKMSVLDIIQSETEETCEYDLWDEDSDTYKCSQCGELWTLITDSPLENNMNYCPKCGRKIIAGE